MHPPRARIPVEQETQYNRNEQKETPQCRTKPQNPNQVRNNRKTPFLSSVPKSSMYRVPSRKPSAVNQCPPFRNALFYPLMMQSCSRSMQEL